MKAIMMKLHPRAVELKNRALSVYEEKIKKRAAFLIARIRSDIFEYPDKKERNRRLILLFTFIFVMDYLMYCLHTDKNVVDIFPVIPSFVMEKPVYVYLPSPDGISIIREKRSIPPYESDEKTARLLFETVVRGSIFDNTAMAVPVDLFVRNVWIHGRERGKTRLCVIDVEPAELRSSVAVIKNSESLFRKALEKTITENIPSVRSVLVLEKGVPGAALWEL
jgi:hypothetical protein